MFFIIHFIVLISFTLHGFFSQNTLFPPYSPAYLLFSPPELLSQLCGWLELVTTRAAWYRQLLGVSDGRYKKKNLVWFLSGFPAGESLKRQKFQHIWSESQGSPDRRKHGATPAKFIYTKEFWQDMKRLDSCEGGHVTGLVTCDQDSVIMVLCIGTARTHKCAATAPSLGS